MQVTGPQFRYFNRQAAVRYLRPRAGESKLGEHIRLPQPDGSLPQAQPAPFTLLGAAEDIGVRANLGLAGAAGAWDAFLHAFLNLQENRFLSGKQFMVLGTLRVPDAWSTTGGDDPALLRKRTAEIDAVLAPVLQAIFETGSLPVVIGGGHNNAYPILKAGSGALQRPLNVINIDPHTDYRTAEGRHSGNGFRYARQNGYLKKYALLGLHESYNAEPILAEITRDPDFLPIFWEDIFLRKDVEPEDAFSACLRHIDQAPFGVELDVDGIEDALSSAATPVGLPPALCMSWLYDLGKHPAAAYLHLPEGTTLREDGLQSPFTGKLLSYLVQAFCKGTLSRKPHGGTP